MVDLVFEDPPEHHPHVYDVKKNADRQRIIDALPDCPNRWAVVSRHSSRSRAAQVVRVLRERHPPPYEFRPSTNTEGEGVVYGRYAGPDANI